MIKKMENDLPTKNRSFDKHNHLLHSMLPALNLLSQDNLLINDEGTELTAHYLFSGLVSVIVIKGTVYKVGGTC